MEFKEFIEEKVKEYLKDNNEYQKNVKTIEECRQNSENDLKVLNQKVGNYKWSNRVRDTATLYGFNYVIEHDLASIKNEAQKVKEQISVNLANLKKGRFKFAYLKEKNRLLEAFVDASDIYELGDKIQKEYQAPLFEAEKRNEEIRLQAPIDVVKKNKENPIVNDVIVEAIRLTEKGLVSEIYNTYAVKDNSKLALDYICKQVRKVVQGAKYDEKAEELKSAMIKEECTTKDLDEIEKA